MSKHFAVEVQNEGSVQVLLDYNEKNALRYVGGYVTRVYCTRSWKSQTMKREHCASLAIYNKLYLPDLGVMGPHIVLDDPSLFTAVTLKVYSNPAFRSGIVIDVVSTLMCGMGMGFNPLSK